MPTGVYKRTIIHKQAISNGLLGHRISDKTKKKISQSHSGLVTYIPNNNTRQKMSESHKKNGSGKWMLGKKLSKETRKKMSESKKGNKNPFYRKKHSEETRNKWRLLRRGKQSKEKHPNWKGGITPVNNAIRGSLEYKLWSNSVFNRDCNHCQKCKEKRISKLVSHHILNFSNYVNLRFARDNGITLCRECHKLFHKTYGKKNNNRQQIVEFIDLDTSK